MLYQPPVGGGADDPYVTGVPGVTPGSIPPGGAIEQPQREILSVIAAAGLTPDSDDMTQLAQAIQSGKLISSENTGTADAIVAAFTPAITELTDGLELEIRCPVSNTATTPTFTPNDGVIAAAAIVNDYGLSLQASDIPLRAVLKYDATLAKWLLLNPSTGVYALGFGQSWQALVASRAIGTTYYNTTARPIVVHVRATINTNGNAVVLTIGGVLLFGSTVQSTYASSVSGIVPPGGSYVVPAIVGGGTINEWQELR
jgi:hypothetical protein